MKTYTQKDVDSFPVADGIKRYPTGNYVNCSFGSGCKFYSDCTFGSYCSFGGGCSFGSDCKFYSDCTFGSYCSFGGGCNFGGYCSFGDDCSFGSNCNFGGYCSFSSNCNFSRDCTFESHRARTDNPYIALDRAGSELRKTYIFDFTDGLYVRSGCFFGTLQEFRVKVLADDTTPDKRSAKTLVYLGLANLACAQFNQMDHVL